MTNMLAFSDAPEVALVVFVAAIVGLVILVKRLLQRSFRMYRQGKS